MQVRELRKILENVDDDKYVVIEYVDGPHIYVKEPTFGTRIESHQLVILGESENNL